MEKTSHFKYHVLVIYLTIIFIGFFVAYKSSTFNFIGNQGFTIEGDAFSPDFNSKSTDNDVKHYTYETSVKRVKFDHISHTNSNDESYHIFLYKVADNGVRVFVNDQLVGERGNFSTGNANLWNGHTNFQIPASLITEDTIIRIETYSRYRSGLSAFPIYIVNEKIGPILDSTLDFYGTKLISLVIGFILLSVTVAALLFNLSKADKSLYILSGISSLMLGIYCSDYLVYEYIPFDYLLYKKITMSGLFLGMVFYGYAVAAYYKHKPLKYISHISLTGYILILVLSNQLLVFKEWYTYYYIVLLVNILVWIVIATKNLKNKQSLIFISGFLILILYAASVTLVDIFGGHSRLNTPVVYISILGAMPLLLAYETYLQKEEQIKEERTKRELNFLNSVTDHLTGVWNQRYLYSKRKDNLLGSVVCVIDIDDFKAINDQYGHVAGDYVIKEISKAISNQISPKDDLCRYGGDEFVLLLYRTSLPFANEIMENVLETLRHSPIIYKGTSINVTLSIGMHRVLEEIELEDIIARADYQLYNAKKKGKNQISYPDSLQ